MSSAIAAWLLWTVVTIAREHGPFDGVADNVVRVLNDSPRDVTIRLCRNDDCSKGFHSPPSTLMPGGRCLRRRIDGRRPQRLSGACHVGTQARVPSARDAEACRGRPRRRDLRRRSMQEGIGRGRTVAASCNQAEYVAGAPLPGPASASVPPQRRLRSGDEPVASHLWVRPPTSPALDVDVRLIGPGDRTVARYAEVGAVQPVRPKPEPQG